MPAFEPAHSLKSRTFIGLLVAQFLAAFNDQAIHASAMFFAINQKTMTAANAISLMPILFYVPWAVFCTIAGYLADRYSKRNSLVFWKIAEIGITLIALFGFWLGTTHYHHTWLTPFSKYGPYLVLGTVFLMGTHSAFFVPAKYGSMPEILQPHLLSKGNGLLESFSFLAVILGTVSGGVLSFEFRGREYYIGWVLVALAVIGAAASFLIQKMPAANPTRLFPKNLFKPLLDNLRILLRSKPLALAVLGIAFFTFMVAFMRAAMYMHGETRNPHWSELHTSIVVGVVALGVGLGSPLAGFLSGGKVELGLVPLGAVGMIVSLLLAAFSLNQEPALIACLVAIGFFTGFYIVPMFTLLQHRAPKASKGDLLASSNFVNVVGATGATLLFKFLVLGAGWTGITTPVPQEEKARGTLLALEYEEGRPSELEVQTSEGRTLHWGTRQRQIDGEELVDRVIIEADGSPEPEDVVAVTRYEVKRGGHKVIYFRLRPADRPMETIYNQEGLPTYLFLGASLMTLGILVLLCRQLPDFFVRALLWLRSHGRYHLKVIGLNNLPSDGPVILATNCDRFEDCMLVVAATDRFTRFILLESPRDTRPPPLLRYLARQTGLLALGPKAIPASAWNYALNQASRALDEGHMVGVTVESNPPVPEADRFLPDLLMRKRAVILPVYCGTAAHLGNGQPEPVRRVRVVIGHPLRPEVPFSEVRKAIHVLGEWIKAAEQGVEPPATVMIPGGGGASPSTPAASPPTRP
jgi:MFS family permease/1-acyl-sn-glycerol-3-phosphate acyltransferase